MDWSGQIHNPDRGKEWKGMNAVPGARRGRVETGLLSSEWCVLLLDPETRKWVIVETWNSEDTALLHAGSFGEDERGRVRATVRRGRGYAERECRRMNAGRDRRSGRPGISRNHPGRGPDRERRVAE